MQTAAVGKNEVMAVGFFLNPLLRIGEEGEIAGRSGVFGEVPVEAAGVDDPDDFAVGIGPGVKKTPLEAVPPVGSVSERGVMGDKGKRAPARGAQTGEMEGTAHGVSQFDIDDVAQGAAGEGMERIASASAGTGILVQTFAAG